MAGKLKYCYSIYEISKDCRKHGRLLRTYKTKKYAMRFMEESIYRFCKEVPYILS